MHLSFVINHANLFDEYVASSSKLEKSRGFLNQYNQNDTFRRRMISIFRASASLGVVFVAIRAPPNLRLDRVRVRRQARAAGHSDDACEKKWKEQCGNKGKFKAQKTLGVVMRTR